MLDDNAPSRDVRNELASAPTDNLSYGQSGVKGYESVNISMSAFLLDTLNAECYDKNNSGKGAE